MTDDKNNKVVLASGGEVLAWGETYPENIDPMTECQAQRLKEWVDECLPNETGIVATFIPALACKRAKEIEANTPDGVHLTHCAATSPNGGQCTCNWSELRELIRGFGGD